MAKKKKAPAKALTNAKPKSKTASSDAAQRKPADKKARSDKRDDRRVAGHHAHHDHEHDHSECVDIELDDVESKAIEMADRSERFRAGLELAVNKSLFQAVRKFYREQGTSLSADQAQNVAITLFFAE